MISQYFGRKTTKIKNNEYNKTFINYCDDFLSIFNQIQRFAWTKINSKDNNLSKNELSKILINKYNIRYRTAESIAYNMTGRYNSIKELKLLEYNTTLTKLDEQFKTLNYINNRIETLQLFNNFNQEYKNLKMKKYWLKNKINKNIQKLQNIDNQIETGHYNICFGTKKLLKKDIQQFKQQRDSELYFIGTKNANDGNFQFHLSYNYKKNNFQIKLNTESIVEGYDKNIFATCYFSKSIQKQIKYAIKYKTSPITIKIKKKPSGLYLQLILTEKYDIEEQINSIDNGVIGIDFNKGFVSVSETNKYGDLINTFNKYYKFDEGSKTEYDLKIISNQIVQYAKDKQKPVIIEDLKFSKKKNKLKKGYNKNYNKMLSSLPYSKFKHYIENSTHRGKIYLKKVNTAYTSKIAKQKYTNQRKLNTHQAAAWVIARKGQYTKDEYNKKIA